MRRSVAVVLLPLLLLSTMASKLDRLEADERARFESLSVYMSDDQEKAYLKLKTRELRDAWLKSEKLWDRWYKFEDDMREAILASKAPVFIGHSGCRALVDVPRLSYDEELKRLAERGGVLGIIFWPYIRKQGQQMAADVIRHIEYAVNLCGEDHVGIGTDLGISPVELTPAFVKDNTDYMRSMIEDGIFEKDRDPNLLLFPPDLNTADRFEILAGMLSARGHSDARIAKILGGNFARVMRDVWG